MKLVRNVAALAMLSSAAVEAFTPAAMMNRKVSRTAFSRGVAMNGLMLDDDQLEQALDRQLAYQPGKADTELARRFGDVSGQKIKTVGEAFTEFTEILGQPINPLYRSALTDIVGSTHLAVVSARFQRDPIWSLGLLTAMDMLLKNYPEQDFASKIKSALIQSAGFDEDEVRTEAASVLASVEGMTQKDVAAALRGNGESILASVGKSAKGDEYWMYSKFFGIGLIKIMDVVGVEQNMESAYTVMEDWMGKSLEKSFYTACSDSDQWFKTKSKLDMMETLMKEIEIREKKRMADRLEERAEVALRQAERSREWEEEEMKEKDEVKEKEEVLV